MDDTAPHIVTPSDNCSWQIKNFLINRLHSSKSVATLLVASCRQVLQRSHALRRGLSIYARGCAIMAHPPRIAPLDGYFTLSGFCRAKASQLLPRPVVGAELCSAWHTATARPSVASW